MARPCFHPSAALLQTSPLACLRFCGLPRLLKDQCKVSLLESWGSSLFVAVHPLSMLFSIAAHQSSEFTKDLRFETCFAAMLGRRCCSHAAATDDAMGQGCGSHRAHSHTLQAPQSLLPQHTFECLVGDSLHLIPGRLPWSYVSWGVPCVLLGR